MREFQWVNKKKKKQTSNNNKKIEEIICRQMGANFLIATYLLNCPFYLLFSVPLGISRNCLSTISPYRQGKTKTSLGCNERLCCYYLGWLVLPYILQWSIVTYCTRYRPLCF